MESKKNLLLLSGATFLIHMLVANRYDFFRDELYFIICGRHPALGYVDQPPLVPLLAALTQIFGESLVLLRSIPALAAAATVYVTGLLAMDFGAQGFGVVMSALAVATAPAYLGLMTTLGTSTFDPLVWTLVPYLLIRATGTNQRKFWILLGLVIGLGLETRYSLPFYLFALLGGLALTPELKKVIRMELSVSVAVALIIAAPNFVWQWLHGFPFLELMKAGSSGKNVVLSPGKFIFQQFKGMNPLMAPLWLAGVIGPFRLAQLKRFRFVSLAFIFVFGLMLLIHAKDYYLVPAYPAVLALGGVVVESWLQNIWTRRAWAILALALSAVAAPLAMPILDPPKLEAYIHALHIDVQPAENLKQSPLPQTFADMMGWRSYVEEVAKAYRALSSEEQNKVILLTGNYGEAAALDFFGPRYGLPVASSGHNNYWLWGPGSGDGSVILRVNGSLELYKSLCETAEVIGRFGSPYVMPYENDAPIILCRKIKEPVPSYWARARHFI